MRNDSRDLQIVQYAELLVSSLGCYGLTKGQVGVVVRRYKGEYGQKQIKVDWLNGQTTLMKPEEIRIFQQSSTGTN